jgi:hypothetical protein
MEQFNNNLVLKGRDSVELKPPFLFKEILIYIFETLDTKAMAAVIRTCKYFQLIGEYVSKSDMEICYIGPPETDVRDIFFSNFKYPFDYVSSKLNLVIHCNYCSGLFLNVHKRLSCFGKEVQYFSNTYNYLMGLRN